jgi:DNA-binding NarL/FixJ family response regulator
MNRFKLLIIDDQVDNLQAIVRIFEEHRPEYIIYQTNNPLNTFQIVEKANPDLIITDWNMPEINGIELILKLKADPATVNIPVIMATGVNLSSTDLKVALEAGAVDFIRKPFDPLELIARTHAALLLSKTYKDLIEEKDIQLTESTLHLLNTQNCASEVKRKTNHLINLVEKDHPELVSLINEIIRYVENQVFKNGWQSFNLAFNKIHGSFQTNLVQNFPDLTQSEIKLCSLIKLGLDNKKIAALLFLTSDSIKVSRSRLRKKLKLETNQNLDTYLSQF